jgi:hypothetical protein
MTTKPGKAVISTRVGSEYDKSPSPFIKRRRPTDLAVTLSLDLFDIMAIVSSAARFGARALPDSGLICLEVCPGGFQSVLKLYKVPASFLTNCFSSFVSHKFLEFLLNSCFLYLSPPTPKSEYQHTRCGIDLLHNGRFML